MEQRKKLSLKIFILLDSNRSIRSLPVETYYIEHECGKGETKHGTKEGKSVTRVVSNYITVD